MMCSIRKKGLTTLVTLLLLSGICAAQEPVKVFVFAGQSNMVGADSRVARIDDYPPYVGAAAPQGGVRYAYAVGNERSDGWVPLAPVGESCGPELVFGRRVRTALDEGELAIVKCAVGGTTVAYDWNPDGPDNGQKLYARTVELVRWALEDLRAQGLAPELAGVFWHQGENDMLNRDLVIRYKDGLTKLIAAFREEFESPELDWYIGEISDKGIWGMDHRRNMRVLRRQQQSVCLFVAHTHWVPTSHLAFEVMGSGQPHYHFGTQGQLQLGDAFADAYLTNIDALPPTPRTNWTGKLPAEPLRIFVLLGGRNAEGEDAFVAELEAEDAREQPSVPFWVSVGRTSYCSTGWETLRPLGHLGNFGPEVSLGRALYAALGNGVAIVKYTDSAGLIADFQPESDDANCAQYSFVRSAIRHALEGLGNTQPAQLAGVFWVHGANETYYSPFRKRYTERLATLVDQLGQDLGQPDVPWFVALQSERGPWGAENIAAMNEALLAFGETRPAVHLVPTSDLDHGRIHFGTEGTLQLGAQLAESYLATR